MKHLVLLIGACCLVMSVQAQQGIRAKLRVTDSSVVQIIVTNEGSSLTGHITEISETTVKMVTDVGTLDIEISRIAEYREIADARKVGSTYWFPNPNATRLFITPTARALKQGEAYYQNTYVFINGFAYGLTDHLAVGGGLSLIPGAEEQMWYITPKISSQIKGNLHMAAGVSLFGTTAGGETAGFLYGVATLGSGNASITMGSGIGFQEGEWVEKPLIVLGGEKRISRRVSFVTENLFVSGEDLVASFGLRFFGDRMACDLAFFRPLSADIEGFPFLPYVDFLVFFN